MNSELKKNFILSVLLHAAVFAGIICFTAFAPAPRIEEPIIMELVGGGGGGGGEPIPPPPPPPSKTETPPEPKIEKPAEKPEPAKIEKPKPPDIVIPKEQLKKKQPEKPKPVKKEEPKKTEAKKTETKPKTTEEKPKLIPRSQFDRDTKSLKPIAKLDPRFSASAIAKRLAAAVNSVKVGPPGGGPGPDTGRPGGGASSQFADYYSMLSGLLYDAWDIPGQATPTMSTVVMVHIMHDGSLSFVKIVKSSGNTVMDESATAAVNKVRKVDPLPEGMGNSTDLTITFKPLGV